MGKKVNIKPTKIATDKLGWEIAEKLGLKDELVTGFDLSVRVGEPVRVTVHKFLKDEDTNGLLTDVKEYELIEVEDES